ncbi:MAG: hypothetical protein JW866_08015 [Ignavibacteriales bacterium]|nr:hypothetical protein [Ignavibacteriales bacterium]
MDIRKKLPRPVRRITWNIISFYQYFLWIIKGKPSPPPHIVKVNTIKRYAKENDISNFVETGTYLGDTIDAVVNNFKKIYSIELNRILYKRAVRQFGKHSNVKIIQGDSALELRSVLKILKEPALFWLDAHYSGKGTSKGKQETPIADEVQSVLNTIIGSTSIILIDDARLFKGENDYPKLSEFKNFISKIYSKKVVIKNDIIAIYNRSSAD